jgi:hypothetical protein
VCKALLLLLLLLLLLQVMAKLKSEATGVKGAIVAALLAASNAHIAARRTVSGMDVQYARASPALAVRLAALVTMAVTAPLYALAQKLIFSKVRVRLVRGWVCCKQHVVVVCSCPVCAQESRCTRVVESNWLAFSCSLCCRLVLVDSSILWPAFVRCVPVAAQLKS